MPVTDNPMSAPDVARIPAAMARAAAALTAPCFMSKALGTPRRFVLASLP